MVSHEGAVCGNTTGWFAMREPIRGHKNPDQMEFAIIELIRGRSNAVGVVTLTAGATTTTIDNDNISPTSKIFLSPLTANAAAAIGTTYISSKTKNQVTITHANNGQVDRTFDFLIKTGET